MVRDKTQYTYFSVKGILLVTDAPWFHTAQIREVLLYVNYQIFQETGGVWIEDLYEVIRKQMCARWTELIGNFAQVFFGPQVAAIVHSNY